jgi:hypothetical protein
MWLRIGGAIGCLMLFALLINFLSIVVVPSIAESWPLISESNGSRFVAVLGLLVLGGTAVFLGIFALMLIFIGFANKHGNDADG